MAVFHNLYAYPRPSNGRIFLVFSIPLLLGLACSSSSPQGLNPDQQTAVAQTVAAAFPTSAPTLPPPTATNPPSNTPPASPTTVFPIDISPTAIPPTSTPIPPGPPQRVAFSPGATSATVTGFVPSNSSVLYILRALQGQHTVLLVSSSSQDTFLTFFGANDPAPMPPYSQRSTHYEGILWATQDYIISVNSGGQAASFTLQIQIDPLPASSGCSLCSRADLPGWYILR